MVNRWNEMPFGKLYEIPSRNGLNRPSAVRGEGYKMINMGELFGNDRIGSIEMERVKLSDNEKRNFEVKKNDLLFARQSIVAEGAGKCSIVLEVPEYTCFESHIIRVRLKQEKALPLFYYYLFQSSLGKAYLSTIRLQGVQAGIKGTDLVKLELPYPEPNEQKQIASILSAYDDLIENNQKRIAILEQTAVQIYKEWFVRMRFPGHENAEFKKGLPKGWEVVELKQIANEVSKGTKPGMHLEKRFYLPMELFGQKHFNPESYLSFEEANSSLVTFEKGDILFGAMRPYQHKVCIAPFDGITRTTSFVIAPKDETFYSYLFLLLFQKSTVEFATLICNGSDRPYVVWNKSFEKMKVFKPSKELVEKFEETVRPMLTFISNAFFTIEKLKQTRDLLLPRLISGKLRVKIIKEDTNK